jgi:NAD(P)-dependent dehydrogenase (short-subunit alcohol dehydrogenase family)
VEPFDGKVAIVTGATSGIGRATALAFAHEGARVVVSGRRENEGNEAVARIVASGGRATFVKTDITREADVAALVDAALTTYGRLDVAVNNAGVGEATHDPTHIKNAEGYHRIMNTNVFGVFLSMKHGEALNPDGKTCTLEGDFRARRIR